MRKGQIIIVVISIAALAALFLKFRADVVAGPGSSSDPDVTWSSLPPNPWPTETGVEQAESEGYSIVLVGDIAAGEHVFAGAKDNLLETKGYQHFFDKVAPLLKESDAVIGALSAPLIDGAPEGGLATKHWSDSQKLPAVLRDLNFKALSVANPQVLDQGRSGLDSTIATLEKNGLGWFGAGKTEQDRAKPFYLETDLGQTKLKIAVFGSSSRVPAVETAPALKSADGSKSADDSNSADGSNSGSTAVPQTDNAVASQSLEMIKFELDSLISQIAALKKAEPDTFIIVYPAWGTPYRWIDKSQQDAGRKLVEAGAHLVVGHGTRMMQQIDPHEDGYVFHSVGDFVYNGSKSFESRRDSVPFGMILKLTFVLEDGKAMPQLRAYPINVDNESNDFQPRFVTAREFGRVYWEAIIRSWTKDDRWLKRHLGPALDKHGRYYRIGKSVQSYPRGAQGPFALDGRDGEEG